MPPTYSGTHRVRLSKQTSRRSLSCITRYSKDQEYPTAGRVDSFTNSKDNGDNSQPVRLAPGILSAVEQDYGAGIGSVSLKAIERQLDQLTKDVISRRSAATAAVAGATAAAADSATTVWSTSSKRTGSGGVITPSTGVQSSGLGGGGDPPPGPCRIRSITWDTVGNRIGGREGDPVSIEGEAAIVPDGSCEDFIFPSRERGDGTDSAASQVGNKTVVERDPHNHHNSSVVELVVERTAIGSSPTFVTGANDDNRNSGTTEIGGQNIVSVPKNLDSADTSTAVTIPRSAVNSTDSPPRSPRLDRRNGRPQGIATSLPGPVYAATSARELGRHGFYVGQEQAGAGEAAAAVAESDTRNMLWGPQRDEMKALFRAVVGKAGGKRTRKECRASLLRAQFYWEDVVERQRRYDLNDRFLRGLLQRKFECERLPFLFAARSRSRLHGYSVNDAYEMARKQAARMPPLI